MGDFHEDDFDEHLRLGSVQLFDDLIDVNVGFFVGDDDEGARLPIKLNKGVAKHGVVKVLARAFGCGVASKTASKALPKGVRASGEKEGGAGQSRAKCFPVSREKFSKMSHSIEMIVGLLAGGAANGLGVDGSVVEGVVSLVVLSGDGSGDPVEAVFKHSAQDFGDVVGVGVFQRIDVNFLLLGIVFVQLENHFSNLAHQLAGSADDDGVGSRIGHRDNGVLLLQALILVLFSASALASFSSKESESSTEAKAGLVFFVLVVKKIGQNLGGFNGVGVLQAEDFYLGDGVYVAVNLLDDFFDDGHGLIRRGNDEGVGAFVGLGHDVRNRLPRFAETGRAGSGSSVAVSSSAEAPKKLFPPRVSLSVAAGNRRLKDILDDFLQFLCVGELKREDPNCGNAGDGGVQRGDDSGDALDAGLAVGEDEGVATFVCGERGFFCEQRLKVLNQLHGVGVAHGNDLRDHLIGGGNLLRIRSFFDGKRVFAGLALIDNFEDAPVSNGGVAFVGKDCVQQLDGVFACDWLGAPCVDVAGNFGFKNDDEAGGLAQIVKNGLNGNASKVEFESGRLGGCALERRLRRGQSEAGRQSAGGSEWKMRCCLH